MSFNIAKCCKNAFSWRNVRIFKIKFQVEFGPLTIHFGVQESTGMKRLRVFGVKSRPCLPPYSFTSSDSDGNFMWLLMSQQ
jgi:hypothetical protein